MVPPNSFALPPLEMNGDSSVAMETGEGPLDVLDPDSTVGESRVVVVDYDGGGIERGGSHRSRLQEREGGGGIGRRKERIFPLQRWLCYYNYKSPLQLRERLINLPITALPGCCSQRSQQQQPQYDAWCMWRFVLERTARKSKPKQANLSVSNPER